MELRIPIQKSTLLSKSILWTLQNNFYKKCSLAAWTGETVIPNFVTSNCFIAKVFIYLVQLYSDIIFNNIIDIFNNGYNETEPIYIIELGSGSGKLGFLLIEKLMEIQEFYPKSNREFPFVYVMTEVSQDMIGFYQKHPRLVPLIDRGILDFASFECENDNEIKLIKSGKVISEKTPSLNPLIVLGNYVLDTLTQTCYRIDRGSILNSLCTIEMKAPRTAQIQAPTTEVDTTSPEIINNMIITWNYEKVEKDNIDEDEEIKSILLEYEDMDEGSIIIPIGGIKLLKNLEKLSSQVMFIVGDKGYSSVSELSGHRDPHIALHGSFSFMVNFDAICKYIKNHNGHYINTPYTDGFKVFTYFLGSQPKEVSNTLFAFSQSLVTFGPESFSTLQRCVKEESIPKFKHLQALLRLSDGDPDVFYKFRGIIVEQGTNNISPDGGNSDLILDLKRVISYIFRLQMQFIHYKNKKMYHLNQEDCLWD